MPAILWHPVLYPPNGWHRQHRAKVEVLLVGLLWSIPCVDGQCAWYSDWLLSASSQERKTRLSLTSLPVIGWLSLRRRLSCIPCKRTVACVWPDRRKTSNFEILEMKATGMRRICRRHFAWKPSKLCDLPDYWLMSHQDPVTDYWLCVFTCFCGNQNVKPTSAKLWCLRLLRLGNVRESGRRQIKYSQVGPFSNRKLIGS